MTLDRGREQAVVEDAVCALFGLDERIAALADVDWNSPAAFVYRTVVADLAAACTTLRIRLAAYSPDEP